MSLDDLEREDDLFGAASREEQIRPPRRTREYDPDGFCVIEDTLTDVLSGNSPVYEPLDPETVERFRPPIHFAGVASLDHSCGGPRGMTVIGGPAGSAKSILGARMLYSAASDGTTMTLGAYAEMLKFEVFDRLAKTGPDAERMMEQGVLNASLFYNQREGGGGLNRFWAQVYEKVRPGFDRFVLLIDSVHSLARNTMDGDGRGFLEQLEELRRTLVALSRLSGGRFCTVAICEENRKGELKGGTWDFDCDMELRLQRVEDEQETVNLRTGKIRGSGGSYRDLGDHAIDANHTCLHQARQEPTRDEPARSRGGGSRSASGLH